jgi:hypothetical protein
MSYTEYLRTKLASQQMVVNVRNSTDASMATTKTRMMASRVFLNGGAYGTLTKQTDRPVDNNPSNSAYKTSGGRVPDASAYTAHRGYIGIGEDLPFRAGGQKLLPCVNPSVSPPTPGGWKYPTASSVTRSIMSCPSQRGDDISNIQFSDNTIRLSAAHPRMVAVECCGSRIEDANHTASPGIQPSKQPYALGKGFFMSSPPLPEGPNVSDHKVGGYLGPRPPLVYNNHGFAGRTRPRPVAPGGQGQDIPQLKINKPSPT